MTATYGYDSKGRLLSTNDFQNVQSTFSYDDANLLKTVTENSQSHTIEMNAAVSLSPKTGQMVRMEMFCYNRLGRIASDGVNTYTYDGNGNLRRRLGDVKVNHAGGASTFFGGRFPFTRKRQVRSTR